MRTLHLLKTSVGARWALLQLRELMRLGIDCHVVVPRRSRPRAAVRRAGVNVHVLDLNAMPATPAWFRAARALRSWWTSQSPDVVHSHFVATTLLMR